MVSFDLTDDQKLIRDTLVDFAKNELRSKSHDADEEAKVPADIIEKGWGLGLVQQAIPEEFGGLGQRSAVTGAIAAEELAYGDLSMALNILAPGLFAVPLALTGTPEQKKKYLPKFTGGKFHPATLAVVEPRFGFDLHSLQTAATPDKNGYTLEGQKCFVPLAAEAEEMLVFAQVKGEKDGGVAGFIVEKGAPGLKAEREKNMGLKALPTYEVSLQKTHVPLENRLGEGKPQDFHTLMAAAKVGLGASAVGMARAAFEYATKYAKERVAFGEPIAQRQSIAFMIAEMAIEIDAARLLLWEAAWRLDKGKDATKEAYLAKNYASDMVMKVTDRAVQILGGHGYIRDHPVEMWMRNARGFATFEGMVMV